jgi:hypothetical protein
LTYLLPAKISFVKSCLGLDFLFAGFSKEPFPLRRDEGTEEQPGRFRLRHNSGKKNRPHCIIFHLDTPRTHEYVTVQESKSRRGFYEKGTVPIAPHVTW